MVMPNLSTPVATTKQAVMYLEQIRNVPPLDSPDFRPLSKLLNTIQLVQQRTLNLADLP